MKEEEVLSDRALHSIVFNSETCSLLSLDGLAEAAVLFYFQHTVFIEKHCARKTVD